MANPEHLKTLKRGVGAWNAWRDGHTDFHPNLSMVDLSGRRLVGANFAHVTLTGTDLSRANLAGANLREALLDASRLNKTYLRMADLAFSNLSEADLTGASLRGADLTGANARSAVMRGADLYGALLSAADLTGADLAYADLSGAGLSAADLTRARFLETLLVDADLSRSVGLDRCVHHGPSAIDFRTLARSLSLPDVFLRGVGLPDGLIEYFPTLLGETTNYAACFISYSDADRVFAERLYNDLQHKGVRCWFAPEDLKIGERIRHGIDEAIRVHDRLLLILSEASVSSQWVEDEVERALAKERRTGATVLLPICVDRAVFKITGGWVEYIHNTRNIGDFTRWRKRASYETALDRLVRGLRAEVNGEPLTPDMR